MAENLRDLYLSIEQKQLAQTKRGEKKAIFIEFVQRVSRESGKTELLANTLVAMAKQVLEKEGFKVNKSYFYGVLQNTWETRRDSDNHLWVDVAKELPKAVR